MAWNVPDDWGCYYRKCDLCGNNYHMSEGGCGCLDDLQCQCGKGRWDGDRDNLRCTVCNTGPSVETINRTTKHLARKDHKDGKIKAGDNYRCTVTGGYFPGGRRWMTVTKIVLQIQG